MPHDKEITGIFAPYRSPGELLQEKCLPFPRSLSLSQKYILMVTKLQGFILTASPLLISGLFIHFFFQITTSNALPSAVKQLEMWRKAFVSADQAKDNFFQIDSIPF